MPRAPRMGDGEYTPSELSENADSYRRTMAESRCAIDQSARARASAPRSERHEGKCLGDARGCRTKHGDGNADAAAAEPRMARSMRAGKRAREPSALEDPLGHVEEDELGDVLDDGEPTGNNAQQTLTHQAKQARMDASEWFSAGAQVEVCDGIGWTPGICDAVQPGCAWVTLANGRSVEASPDNTSRLRPGRSNSEPKPLGQYKQGERAEVWRELRGERCWCRAEVLAAEPQHVTARFPDTEENFTVQGSEDIRPERMWDGFGKWRAASKKRPYFDDQDPYIKLLAECSKCRGSTGRRSMVKCSSCPRHWHIYCLDPPCKDVPPKPWRCPQCEDEMKDTAAEEAARTKGNVDVIIGQRQNPESLEFLVKYDKRGYKDAEWLPERAVRTLADRKLKAFWRKHGMDGCEAHIPPDYCRVDRVILAREGALDATDVGPCGTSRAAIGNVESASRPTAMSEDGVAAEDEDDGPLLAGGASQPQKQPSSDAGPVQLPPPPPPSGREDERALLVKWQSLGYDQATWEWETDVKGLQNGESELRAYDFRSQQPKTHPSKTTKQLDRLNDQPEAVRECGDLHRHQLEGVNWLLQKLQAKEGAILGDEMGLGKTIQAGAFLTVAFSERLMNQPALVVAPLSTLSSWGKELKQWCPHLNVVTYVGSAESRQLLRHYELSATSPRLDVLLTSYEVANQDSWIFQRTRFSATIVDEGHRLKSADSKLARTLSALQDEFRLILTGTPLQNNLEELFALLHFIDPCRYRDPTALAQTFTKQQQQQKNQHEKNFHENGSLHQQQEAGELGHLHDLLRKHMLRRLKREVMPDMPLKRKREVHCGLSSLQQSLYADVLARNHKAVNLFNTSNKRVSLINVLKELQKVCNHPFLFPGVEPEAKKAEEGTSLLVEASGKLCVLAKLLPRLRADGHRCLLFCQMTQMLDVLEDFMRELGLPYCRIDGSTSSKERQQVIDRFNANDSDVFIFLISTRAGGLGINLPSADTVFIYDPDFNPFVDLQAQGRAHRIGQRREVMVYQLVTDDTVEEQILSKAKKKLAIERLVVREKGSDAVSSDELKGILTHGAVNLLNKARGGVGGLADAGDFGSTARLYATDNIVDTLIDRENAPVVEDDVESQGYLGKIESHQEQEQQAQQHEEDTNANESSALDQLLQERHAKIEAQEQKDDTSERRRQRRQARAQTEYNPPEGKLADDDDGLDDPPG